MTGYRLLVIEDDPDISDLICRVAEDLEFETLATSESDVLSPLLDSFRPHIIVLDIMMPKMDGFEVLNLLHARKSSSRVMVLSGQDTFRTMACRMGEGFQLAVAGGLSKPFRVGELRLALQEIRATLPTPPEDNPMGAVA